MNKQYLYLIVGCIAAVVAAFLPDVISSNFNHPAFWYTVIGILATALAALTFSTFNLAKRINPKTHLL
ncbi:MAG: hypothetical protein EOP51_20855 [Sphingobacteriales bacterium]|nr:MAG: hypothetical protein EOP51_20855 [Sphingobacteriales bacterium]